jgi:hypothetical protein
LEVKVTVGCEDDKEEPEKQVDGFKNELTSSVLFSASHSKALSVSRPAMNAQTGQATF